MYIYIYVGGLTDFAQGGVTEATLPIHVTIIRWFIVLFPALDVTSAFPLNAIVLGNNLTHFSSPLTAASGATSGAGTGQHHEQTAISTPGSPRTPAIHDTNTTTRSTIGWIYTWDTAEVERSIRRLVRRICRISVRKRKIFMRLLAAVPPLLGAAYIHDLGKVTDFTGITALAIAFVFPAILAIASERKCVLLDLDLKTPNSHILTSSYIQYTSASLGIFLCVYVLINLLYS